MEEVNSFASSTCNSNGYKVCAFAERNNPDIPVTKLKAVIHY
jgi:hypothetical protein